MITVQQVLQQIHQVSTNFSNGQNWCLCNFQTDSKSHFLHDCFIVGYFWFRWEQGFQVPKVQLFLSKQAQKFHSLILSKTPNIFSDHCHILARIVSFWCSMSWGAIASMMLPPTGCQKFDAIAQLNSPFGNSTENLSECTNCPLWEQNWPVWRYWKDQGIVFMGQEIVVTLADLQKGEPPVTEQEGRELASQVGAVKYCPM